MTVYVANPTTKMLSFMYRGNGLQTYSIPPNCQVVINDTPANEAAIVAQCQTYSTANSITPFGNLQVYVYNPAISAGTYSSPYT